MFGLSQLCLIIFYFWEKYITKESINVIKEEEEIPQDTFIMQKEQYNE